jgi:hypothetical protein
MYLNSGFVALSTARWPSLLERWWDACALIPTDRVFATENNPFRDGDQDVLNAILMSEVAQEQIAVLPYEGEVHPDAENIVIEDEARLVCTNDGEPVAILHQSLRPKVWADGGLIRLRINHPYNALFPRVVFGNDVALRLDPDEVPWWLRPSLANRLRLWATQFPRRGARPFIHRARRLRSSVG